MATGMRRREFLRGAVALGAGWALIPRLSRASEPGAASGSLWLGGDLHCHTVYSHDVWSPTDDNTGLDEAYTYGWTAPEQVAIAESRALDFLAITDHNDVRWMQDGTYSGYAGPMTLVPGYEHSLSKGHAGCLGVTSLFSIDTSTDAGAILLRDAVRNAGGTFILNHPKYGNGWRYGASVRPDSVEVWNIGWPYRKPLFQGVSTSENYESLLYWEQTFLATGRMPATGGSDNHYRATTPIQGVGQPTTWVLAADRSPGAILAGIKAGRTTVSAEPAALGGARLFLEVRSGSSAWGIGDTVPTTAGQVTVAVRALNAPGHFLQVFRGGGAGLGVVQVTSHDFAYETTVDAATASFVRAELYGDRTWWMAALTSPVYFA